MEDSSMINMPALVFDEKVGNKRVRDGEEEIHTARLEKRPSGIVGESGGDHAGDEGGDGGGGGGGGIIDTLISNVFHKPRSGIEDVVEDVDEDEDKGDDFGGVGASVGDNGEGDGGSGGGIISAFFPNIFHHNGSVDKEGDYVKSDHLLDEKIECAPGCIGENDGGDGEPEDLNPEKLPEKKDEVVDLPAKDPPGPALLKPDDYAERVFFLNNN